MISKKILLVDDDALLRQSLAYNLKKSGYQIKTAASAEDGINQIEADTPDLVLLDVGLPGIDGLEALKRIRGEMNIPVIMLTGRRKELDEILGLEMGADDYVTKPFDLDVLLAHIKAVIRRSSTQLKSNERKEKITAGDISIDPNAHTVYLGKKMIALSPREFDLLYLLVHEADRVVTTEDVLSNVWGDDFIGQPQVVYVHIRWLRQKIEIDPMNPGKIITIHGVGYKFQTKEL